MARAMILNGDGHGFNKPIGGYPVEVEVERLFEGMVYVSLGELHRVGILNVPSQARSGMLAFALGCEIKLIK